MARYLVHVARYRGLRFARGGAGRRTPAPRQTGPEGATGAAPAPPSSDAGAAAASRAPPELSVPGGGGPVPEVRRERGAYAGNRASPAGTGENRSRAEGWPPEMKLAYLAQKVIGDCRRCRLAAGRRNLVFGVGDPRARILFVGEGPGAEEDARGEPFVGPAGRLLDRWLGRVGLSRSSVYIANVVKCRPPGNRDPRPDEVDTCAPFLRAQIRAILPSVIVALGRHAAMFLSGRHDLPLGRLRATRLAYRDPRLGDRTIPLIATYHPAFILRKPEGSPDRERFEGFVIDDLRRALERVGAGPARG